MGIPGATKVVLGIFCFWEGKRIHHRGQTNQEKPKSTDITDISVCATRAPREPGSKNWPSGKKDRDTEGALQSG